MDVRTFGMGLFLGFAIASGAALVREYYKTPDITYSHYHDGRSYLPSKSRITLEGAKFDGEEMLLGNEPPMSVIEMIDEAKHDWERYKLMDQLNGELKTPVKRVDILVWK